MTKQNLAVPHSEFQMLNNAKDANKHFLLDGDVKIDLTEAHQVITEEQIHSQPGQQLRMIQHGMHSTGAQLTSAKNDLLLGLQADNSNK